MPDQTMGLDPKIVSEVRAELRALKTELERTGTAATQLQAGVASLVAAQQSVEQMAIRVLSLAEATDKLVDGISALEPQAINGALTSIGSRLQEVHSVLTPELTAAASRAFAEVHKVKKLAICALAAAGLGAALALVAFLL